MQQTKSPKAGERTQMKYQVGSRVFDTLEAAEKYERDNGLDAYDDGSQFSKLSELFSDIEDDAKAGGKTTIRDEADKRLQSIMALAQIAQRELDKIV